MRKRVARWSHRSGAVLVLSLLPFFGISEVLAICVKVSRANIRSGPSTSARKVWEVYRYMPLRKVRTQGAWYQVRDVDGDANWIHSSLVTADYSCGVVKVKEVNLRSGPGTRYPKIGTGDHYHSFRVLKTKGSWVQVKDEYSDVFWVFRSLIWIQ